MSEASGRVRVPPRAPPGKPLARYNRGLSLGISGTRGSADIPGGLVAKSPVSSEEIPASRTEGGELRSESLLGDFSISKIRIGVVQRPVAFPRRPVRIRIKLVCPCPIDYLVYMVAKPALEAAALCNWLVDGSGPNALCVACRLNRTIPDLNDNARSKRRNGACLPTARPRTSR
jgi:hypothetical protein